MSSTTKKQPMEILGEEISTQLQGFNKLQVQNQKLTSIDMFTKVTLKHIKVDPKSDKRVTLLANLGIAYKSLFIRFGQLKDIDDAISHLSQVTKDASSHPDQHNHLSALAASHQLRFGLLGEVSDIEQAVTQGKEAVHLVASKNDRYLQLAGLAHSQAKLAMAEINLKQKEALIGDAINNLLEATQLASQGHPDLPEWHTNLGDWHYSQAEISSTTQQADSTKAKEHWDKAVQLAGQTKPSVWCSAALGHSYMIRTKIDSPNDQKKFAESAVQHYLVVAAGTPHDHPDRSLWLTHLGLAHKLNEQYSGHDKRIDNLLLAAESLKKAVLSPSGRPLDRIQACKHLANLDNSPKWDAIKEKTFAYKTALGIIQKFIWIGKSIEQRYKDSGLIADLAREAAAFAFSQNNPFQGIEWLEMGRGVILRQIIQFLPHFVKSAPKIDNIDKSVNHHFRDVSQELGDILMTSTNGFAMENIKQKVHRLAEEYEELIKKNPEIHGISGLQPKTAQEYLTIVNSVKIGPVVVINVHKSRSDVLILLPEVPGSSQPSKPRHHARILSFELKPIGKLSVYDDLEVAHRDLNKALWDAKIRQRTDVSSGESRTIGVKRTVTIEGVLYMLADYVVSSYTPTLHLWASMAALPLPNHPNISMLAIAQETSAGAPDLPGTKKELKNIEDVVNKYNLENKSSQQNINLEILKNGQVTLDTVLNHLGKHYFVHIACHAKQEIKDPLKSGILLQQKKLLTVGQLLKSPLQDYNRYIFLSACETSKGNLQSDEPFHLAAAMLFRFFGVIATRWAIQDKDAPLVAQVTYEMLLKNGWNNHGALAKALHIAVHSLRKSAGQKNYERWVCFVHFGF
ncbi:Aromatic di-alanine and TPR containing protein [Ceratobasidium theobromae]|uniref:Aromatic di-alanine and TPR containing protein n=1 Tax=Ceratobasidium theobromae TaxID=1582974 RepID=A0A5N5QJ50_9AGAM|nr:Aromatic di-alanine and TPR containing protein [Ceratobasidium theobromae]